MPSTSGSAVVGGFTQTRPSTRRGHGVFTPKSARISHGGVGTSEPSFVARRGGGRRGSRITVRATRNETSSGRDTHYTHNRPPPGVARRRTKRNSDVARRAIPEPPKMRIGRSEEITVVGSHGDPSSAATSSNISPSLMREFDSRTEETHALHAQRDTDIEFSTLPQRPPGKSSTAQAMANSVNILLGVGLLSVPYALKQGGWAGLGVLGLLGMVTNYTGKVLIRCQDAGSLPGTVSSKNKTRPLLSYEDIGQYAFGDVGRTFITTVLYTELLGTCALFFILEGDHLSLLFENVQGLRHSSQWWQTASAFAMVPTLWLADLSSLSYVGALGAVASVSLMGVVAYQMFLVPGFGTGLKYLPPGFESTALLHLQTLPVSFGLLAFVFAGHAVFPAIYTSMEKPEEYEGMLDKTYVIVGITCAVIGAAGYSLYGDAVKDEVTLNLPTGIASTVALALIAVNPLSKFALTMDPVARGFEERLGIDINVGGMEGRSGSVDSEGLVVDPSGPLKARVLRTGLGASALLIAAKVPFFAVVMSLIGSFLTLTVSVIFPAACHLKVFEKSLTKEETLVDWTIMILGGFCVVAGSTSAVSDLLAK